MADGDQPLGVITNFVTPVDQTGFQQSAPVGPIIAVAEDSTPPPPPPVAADQPPAVIPDDNVVDPVVQADQNTEPDGTIQNTPPPDQGSSAPPPDQVPAQ